MKIQSVPRPVVRDNAFTLVEVLVTTTILAMCLAGALATLIMVYRTFTGVSNYTNMNRQSRLAVDKMTRDIRQTGSLSSGTPTSLIFSNLDGTLLQYGYNAAARTLTYTNISTHSGGTLLQNCGSLTFSMFQFDPVPGTTMVFTNTTTAANCKVIVLDWTCSKTNLLSINTEMIQTAKIVLRN